MHSSTTLLAITTLLQLSTASPLRRQSNQQCSEIDIGYNVTLVVERARQLASHSWEYGTLSEALLELYSPQYAVFSTSAFPNASIPQPSPDIPSLAYAKPHIRLNNATLVDGDGASGDPASLGVSALLLGTSNSSYTAASTREYNHLLSVPKMSNGAISQRDTAKQAWADFVYMAPPFLAYYAVASNNVSLLAETVRQCGLYRDLLQNRESPNAYTYWRHIDDQSAQNMSSSMQDNGFWSTGNGWAAAGMTRVLATLQNWNDTAETLQVEQSNLIDWILEIVDGARSVQRDNSTNLLPNYLNNATWFGDVSGTALLASVVYRMAVLVPTIFADQVYLNWADESRLAVAKHVTNNGTLSPAVNPLNWFDETPYTAGSPEGESFGILLYSAYRDWKCFENRNTGWETWRKT